jgi:hypothetical protein
VVELAIHVQKFGNKRTSPSTCATTAYFGGINPYKKMMNNNNNF